MTATLTKLYEIDGQTVSTTEYSVVNGGTTLQSINNLGLYYVEFDPAAMAKGDVFRFRIYNTTEDSPGTKRVKWFAELFGAQSSILSCPEGILLSYGWDVTIQRIAGSDRAFDATIWRVGE